MMQPWRGQGVEAGSPGEGGGWCSSPVGRVYGMCWCKCCFGVVVVMESWLSKETRRLQAPCSVRGRRRNRG